MAIYT